MNTVRIKCPAKVNLTLDITGVRAGYHTLESLAVTVGLFDELTLAPRGDGRFTVKMYGEGCEDLPQEDNNALRAAAAFKKYACGRLGERFSSLGADITIKKGIPVGAGLGGSSADAAGVLLALAKLCSMDDVRALGRIADGLGSDVRFMLLGGCGAMCGRGECVVPVAGAPLWFIFLIPPVGVSAGACYAQFDRLGIAFSQGLPCLAKFAADFPGGEYALGDAYAPLREEVQAAFRASNGRAVCQNLRNALFEPAASLCPDIRAAFKEAACLGADGVGMSGSGSAVYGAFTDEERALRAFKNYKGKFRALFAAAYGRLWREDVRKDRPPVPPCTPRA